MRGELDWIVMKALEKDRNRRYETANGLAMDVQRYLADEPVLACPPSVGYRLRKFVRRNKGPVLAASLVASALVAGVVGTTIGLVRAEQRAEGERRAKDTAEKRLAQIEKGIDLLGSLFEDLDPYAEEKEGRPLRAILGDRLDQAAADWKGKRSATRSSWPGCKTGWARRTWAWATPPRRRRCSPRPSRPARPSWARTTPSRSPAGTTWPWRTRPAGSGARPSNLFEQVRDARVKVLGADHLDTLSTLHDLGDGVPAWPGSRPRPSRFWSRCGTDG